VSDRGSKSEEDGSVRRPPEGASTSGPAGPVFSYLGQVVPGQFGTILPPDLDWLEASPAEEVLLADLPIVDSHHHLWDADRRGARSEPPRR